MCIVYIKYEHNIYHITPYCILMLLSILYKYYTVYFLYKKSEKLLLNNNKSIDSLGSWFCY